jgi:hypothetical protein
MTTDEFRALEDGYYWAQHDVWDRVAKKESKGEPQVVRRDGNLLFSCGSECPYYGVDHEDMRGWTILGPCTCPYPPQ